MTEFSNVFPYFAEGKVVKGFGRGSKSLGCPTANYAPEVVDKLPSQIDSGVYYGFASVEDGPVYKMVMSVGWNPHFNNTVKTMEVYIMHEFEEDFYGKHMKIVMLGFLRPQQSFDSLEGLIQAIQNDIRQADKNLDDPELAKYRSHEFFKSKSSSSEVAP